MFPSQEATRKNLKDYIINYESNKYNRESIFCWAHIKLKTTAKMSLLHLNALNFNHQVSIFYHKSYNPVHHKI